MKAKLIVLLVLITIVFEQAAAVGWLSVGLSSTQIGKRSAGSFCKELRGLTRRQLRFCRKNVSLMDSVRRGAQNAYAECQYQFHKRRWNCTLIDPVTYEIIGDVFLSEGTRESAFVHAISAAGVAYRVTRDCARGMNEGCGCDQTRQDIPDPTGQNTKFESHGCSDNVQYGVMISREFVDAAEKARDRNGTAEQQLINLHNNRAGRQVLEKSLRRECKCHGISGSCEMKTCWDALPSFREIGAVIKDKFDGATEVLVIKQDNKLQLKMKNAQFKRHTNADLVFSMESPDYCNPDPERGIFGTKGRECNGTSPGIDGCDLMCCNRGFERKVTVIQDKCNCKFHYCCKVICEPCERTIEKFYCL